MDEAQRKEHFRELYEAAYGRILGYALRRAATPEDAADLVAETFLVAWRRYHEVPPRDEALLWLYGIAHKLLANQRRGRRRREALTGRLTAELAASLPSWDRGPADLAPLVRAWRRLRDADRELLGLLVWEDLSTEQLGRVLGCSRTALKVRLHRARRRFAAELRREGVAPGGVGRLAALKPAPAAGHDCLGRTPVRPDTEERS